MLFSLQIFSLPADVQCLPVSLVSYLLVILSHCYIPSLSRVSRSHFADDIRKTGLPFNPDVNGFFYSELNSHRNVGQWDDVNPAQRVQRNLHMLKTKCLAFFSVQLSASSSSLCCSTACILRMSSQVMSKHKPPLHEA